MLSPSWDSNPARSDPCATTTASHLKQPDNFVAEFSMLESATVEHKFMLTLFQPTDPKNFIKFLRKEIQLLRTSLPSGIHVKGFEDRMVSQLKNFLTLSHLFLKGCHHLGGFIARAPSPRWPFGIRSYHCGHLISTTVI